MTAINYLRPLTVRKANSILCLGLLLLAACSSSTGAGAGLSDSGSTPADSGDAFDASGNPADASGADGASAADASALDAQGDGAIDGPAEAADSAQPSRCAPCTADLVSCIDVRTAVVFNPVRSQLPDGTCVMGDMALSCGGTGTDAKDNAITWSVNPPSTFVIVVGSALLNCNTCAGGVPTSTCNAMWAN